MTILNYKGVDYNVVLVDPSIATSGDGTTPATALKDLPTVLVDNTCYLIRRTNIADGFCFVNYQPVNQGILHNIMFLGMPKSTDEAWIQALVTDATVNSAWKADLAPQANVKFDHKDIYGYSSVENAVINDSTLEWCTGINLYCFRQDATQTYSDCYNYTSAMFSNGFSMDYKTKFEFYNCKFGTLNYNIDLDQWLSENEYNTIDGPSPNQWYDVFGHNYIVAKRADNLVLKNCVLNIHGRAYSNDWTTGNDIFYGQGIRINEIKSATIEDCTINGCRIYSGEQYGACIALPFVDSNLSVNNVRYNLILRENYIRPLLLTAGRDMYGKIQIHNVQVRLKSFATTQYNGAISNSYNRCYGGIVIGQNYYATYQMGENFSLKGYDVDCSTGSVKLAEGNFLSITAKLDGHGMPYSDIIKDVSIKMHDDPSECFLTQVSSDQGISTVNINLPWRTYYDGRDTWDDNFASYNKSAFCKIENIYVESPASGYLLLHGAIANIDKLYCRLVSDRCQLQVNELKYDVLDNEAVILQNSNNYLRIKDLILSDSRSSNSPAISGIFDNYNRQNNVYIDQCNNENVFDITTDSNLDRNFWYSNAICANAGDEGKFIQRNRNTLAQSWSVIRTGSDSEASLKVNNNTASNGVVGLTVCPRPFKAFEVTPASTGKMNLIAYFAYKGFNTSDEVTGKQQFKIEVDVPYQVSTNVFDTYTYTSNDWESDNSTWTDPEAVARKIIIPINVTVANKPIEVRVNYNWFSNSGCIYFDPDIRLS